MFMSVSSGGLGQFAGGIFCDRRAELADNFESPPGFGIISNSGQLGPMGWDKEDNWLAIFSKGGHS